MKKEYPKTPELDKLKAVVEKSQAVGEFVDVFLTEKGFSIGKPHKHDNHCPGWRKDGTLIPGKHSDCGYHSHEFESIGVPIQELLAEFFEIDENKCEAERRAILKFIQT